MADKDDKVKIEKEGDLKNSGSDIGSLLGSSSETVDLELADVNSADAKKKDNKTLEINLKTAATDADDGGARLAAALVTDSEEDDSPPPAQPPPDEEAALQTEQPTEQPEENQAPEKDNPPLDPSQQKKPDDESGQKQPQPTNQPVQTQPSVQPQTEAPQTALPDQYEQFQQPGPQAPEQPPVHPNEHQPSVPQQAPTAKNPPTTGQTPQSQPPHASPTSATTHDPKNPPKLDPEKPTGEKQPTANLQPSTVSKEALRDIGPHGNLENSMSQAGQHTDPNKKIPTNQQNQVGNDLNSQKLMQPDGDHAKTNNQTANKPLQTTNTSGLSTNTEDKNALNALSDLVKKFKEEQQKEEEAYQKMNALQKLNRTKQQKKLLKELNKKNDKLIGLIDRMLLTKYFPIVLYKILRYQEEIGKLIKQLSKKKTIHRNDGPMNKLDSEIFFFEALVIYPILKTGATKDAVKRFRKYWLSWSTGIWWGTFIMAAFDLLIIFPFIFLLFGSVFDGPGIRLLKKIRKRNRELTEILTKIGKLAKPKGGDNENYIWHQKSYED